MNLPVDDNVRQQALDPQHSFIVQAPAGSGKTGLLVRRFLRLLSTVEAPEQILAVTFTRKATAEMRLRIRNALQGLDARGQTETDAELVRLSRAAGEHDRKEGWNLARNSRRLRIQTIDSFCYELVKKMPWSARFGTVPPPLEDATRLYRQAADATLGMVEEDRDGTLASPCARLLHLLEANRHLTRELLVEILATRDRWMQDGWIQDLSDHSREQFVAWRQQTVGDTLQECDLLLAPEWRSKLAALARYAAQQLKQSDYASNREGRHILSGWLECRDFPAPEVEALPRWQALAYLLLTKDGQPRRQLDRRIGFPTHAWHQGQGPIGQPGDTTAKAFASAQKEHMKRLLGQLFDSEPLRLAWVRVARLPSPVIDDDDWETIHALLGLLPTAVAQLRVLFTEQHLGDFTEIAQRADWALGDMETPSDLTLALDYQLRHILLDEFQDTSVGQVRLLEKLLAGWEEGDGRTLFLVGDPMQSIYRFRGAEVGNFLAVQDRGIGGIRPTQLTLASNFRSAPALVDWFNQTFARVMPADRNITHGAVNYTEASAFQSPDPGSGVFCHTAVDCSHEAEANRVVSLIAETLKKFPQEEIAVLGRSRSHLNAIMHALKAHDIPFQGIRLESLAHCRAVQDLVSLTLTLAQPADQVAWLSLLRAPWGGATLDELVHLVGEPPRRLVPEALQDEDCLAGCPPESRLRLTQVRNIVLAGLQELHRFPLHRTLEACWIRLGGPAVVDTADLEHCRRFIDLVRELESDGTPIHGETLNLAMEDLFADNHTVQQVKLLTIHSAKGLEFPTVILPGLQRSPRSDQSELFRWKRFPDRLLISTRPRRNQVQPFFDYLGLLEKDHQTHERGRLLYVACTRAQRRLHLFGSFRAQTSNPSATSLLYPLCQAIPPQQLDRHERWPEPDIPEVLPPTLERINPAWTLPELPKSVDPRSGFPNSDQEEEGKIDFDWARETTRITGIVVHRMLEEIDSFGWESWKSRDFGTEDRERWSCLLMAQGLPKSRSREALEQVETALLRVQEDPLAAWIFAPEHTEVRTELGLTGMHDRHLRRVVLDRCFVDINGVRWIIDFKSSRHDDQSTIDHFIDAEKERYRMIMGRYGQMLSALEQRPVRTALYYPLLGRLVAYEAAGP